MELRLNRSIGQQAGDKTLITESAEVADGDTYQTDLSSIDTAWAEAEDGAGTNIAQATDNGDGEVEISLVAIDDGSAVAEAESVTVYAVGDA